MAASSKKRNPQDATRRNVQSANKRIAGLNARVKALELQAHDLWATGAKLDNLERRLMKLEKAPRQFNENINR